MIKTLSIITAAYIFLSFWVSQIYTSTAMPLLFSAGFLAAAIKLLLVLGLVYLATRKKFRFQLHQQLAGITGMLLLAFGTAGSLSTDIQFHTYPFLMSMDYVTIIEAGVLMTLASLSYGYQSSKLALHNPTAVNWQSVQTRLLRTQEIAMNLFVEKVSKKQTTSGFRHHSRPVS